MQQRVANHMSQAVVHVLEPIQIEEQYGQVVAVAAGQGNRLGEPVVQQHAVRQIGQKVVLRQVDGLERDRPRGAHIMEHHDGADHLPAPIVDGGGGVFDGRLEPVAPDEQAVRREADGAVELNGLPPSGSEPVRVWSPSMIWNTSASGRPNASCRGQPVMPFGHGIEIGHVARDIDAEHGVADRVERDFRALLFEEQRLFRRLALDDVPKGTRQRIAVEVGLLEIILGAALDGLPGDVLIVRRTDDQDRDVRRRPPDLFEARDALAIRQAQVEQDGRDPVPAQPFEPIDEPRRAFDGKRAVLCVSERLDAPLWHPRDRGQSEEHASF